MTEVTVPYPYACSATRPAFAFSELLELLAHARRAGQRVVTTNGCFDLLHPGHNAFLQQARAQGDLLVVGLNSDAAVRQLKGAGRPLNGEQDRAQLLTALRWVDYVVVFDELLPTAWLEQVRPHIHCKAGDYTAEGLPEGEAVRRQGGEIRILPLRAGFSTSGLVGKLAAPPAVDNATATGYDFFHELLDGGNVLRQTAYRLGSAIQDAATLLERTLRAGGKLLICGNGGSAADAQHFAGELVGRFLRERSAYAAIALTVDSSVLTCVGNDYGLEQLFARQVQALGQPGDLLVAISTSGHSPNVLAAVAEAKRRGLTTMALTGEAPSPLGACCDLLLAVPSRKTPLIQQAHIAIIHGLCGIVEQTLWEEQVNAEPARVLS
jgi:D-sedoheptulose 7-phosphate isomerase